MPYQIDVLAAGSEAKSADAICLRYGTHLGTNYQSQKVVVIDGGYSYDGENVVSHVRDHYRSDHIDLLISTHPDADHVGGLSHIVTEMSVGELWMHLPWENSDGFAEVYSDGRVTDNSLSERLRTALNGAHQLYELANEREIPIRQPFVGCSTADDALIVLGPSEEFYREKMLLLLEDIKTSRANPPSGLMEKAFGMTKSAVNRVLESIHIETLTDDGETSPQNSSSTVILFNGDSDFTLFTGDACIDGITQSLDRLESAGFSPSELKYVMLPHHGSKRNIGPSILDRIFGPSLTEARNGQSAIVSAAPEADKHPSKRVLNAVYRRGGRVWVTGGKTWLFGTASRPGWSPGPPEPFYSDFED